MIFNLKDIDMNNYISWVHNTLLAKFTGYEDIGQLGAPKNVLTAGEDLNNYYMSGLYTFGANYTPINCPEDNSNGWLLVMQWGVNGGTSKQFWFRHGTLGTNDFNVYVRTRIGSEWGSWVEILTETTQKAYRLTVPTGQLNANSNLNSYRAAGMWVANGTGIASTILNTPTTLNFKLICENINNDQFIMQTVISRIGKKWTRVCDRSTLTWTEWEADTLSGIKEIKMNSNGQLVVTSSAGIVATYSPDSITG